MYRTQHVHGQDDGENDEREHGRVRAAIAYDVSCKDHPAEHADENDERILRALVRVRVPAEQVGEHGRAGEGEEEQCEEENVPARKVHGSVVQYILLHHSIKHMSTLKKVGLGVLGVIVLLVLVAGYFGFVPGVSAVFGSNKARDLGVVATPELYKAVNDKLALVRTGDPLTAGTVSYSGSHALTGSFSSEEITSAIAEGTWKNDPIAGDFQMKIHADGSVEAAGLLDRARLDDYLRATGFTDVLAYTGTFSMLPAQVPFYVSGTASITNNKLDLQLTSAELGRLPLPTNAAAASAVESVVDRRIAAIPGLNISSLTFSNGELNFKGMYPAQMNFK